ncbi:MAG TPA: hypothetical protein DHV36_21610 [Desulfobacteraceae bacterium]|nr:hypothetical protein [Desulfobacteraceae bacterium]
MKIYARGERQSERTKGALHLAFTELLKEKAYTDISVGDIIARGNTGRSTFYRYFSSKAYLLVSLHEKRFDRLLAQLASRSAWLSDDPPEAFASFLCMFRDMGGPDVSLAHMLGSDLDYVLHHINRLLSEKVENALGNAFAGEAPTIALDILARSVAGAWCWVVFSWLKRDIRQSPQDLAAAVQRLSRAAVGDAYGLRDLID